MRRQKLTDERSRFSVEKIRSTGGARTGARVLTVNGQKIESYQEIFENIAKAKPDDPIRLTFTLEGEERDEITVVRQVPMGWDSGFAYSPVTETIRVKGVLASCSQGFRRSILNARRILQTITGLITVSIGLIAVGAQVVKASLTNPAEVLRYE